MIGRDSKTWSDHSNHPVIDPADISSDIVLTDPTVSNQHVQVYTITYIEDNNQRIFTYAKDLSTNGSYWRYKHGNHWKELLIGQGKAVLLSDGDRVRLCNGSSFIFRNVPRGSQCPEGSSIIEDEDVKVGLTYSDETTTNVLQSFQNLFKVMPRKLGSGAYGEVWMAVDILRQRQMACKVVRLNKSPQKRSGRLSFSEAFWREVDLLKDISHVRRCFPLLALAHQISRQTSCTLSVVSSPKKSCTSKPSSSSRS